MSFDSKLLAGTMDVQMTAIPLLLSFLNMLVSGQMMEDFNLELITPKAECDLVLVSQPGVTKGKVSNYSSIAQLIYITTDFGRGTTNFQNVQKLLEVGQGEIFRSMSARVSCLLTIARISNDLEASQLIDIMKGFKIAEKYLVIFAETLNNTLLRRKPINFNVMINHRYPGVPI